MSETDRIPLRIEWKQLNKETLLALIESEQLLHDCGSVKFSDVEEALIELKKDN